MKRLILIRGASGSGKTDTAEWLSYGYMQSGYTVRKVAADDYFVNSNGVYEFDGRRLRYAHEWCYSSVWIAMTDHLDVIIVHNTFTQGWEMDKYKEAASERGYDVCVMLMENDFGNTHNVPDEIVKKQRERIEFNNQ